MTSGRFDTRNIVIKGGSGIEISKRIHLMDKGYFASFKNREAI